MNFPKQLPSMIAWTQRHNLVAINSDALKALRFFTQNLKAVFRAWTPRSEGGQFDGTVIHADYRYAGTGGGGTGGGGTGGGGGGGAAALLLVTTTTGVTQC
jgi:hypothetical protein